MEQTVLSSSCLNLQSLNALKMNTSYVYLCLGIGISTVFLSVGRTFFLMQIYVYLFLYGHSNFLSYEPESPKWGFPITVEQELNNLLFKTLWWNTFLSSQMGFFTHLPGKKCTPVISSMYALGYKGSFRDTVLISCTWTVCGLKREPGMEKSRLLYPILPSRIWH